MREVARRHPTGHRHHATVWYPPGATGPLRRAAAHCSPPGAEAAAGLTRSGDLDSAVMAGTMKEPMAKVPAGIQQVWVQGDVITNQERAAA